MLEGFIIDQGLNSPLNEKFQNFMTFISPTMFPILLLLTSFFFLFLEPNKVISVFLLLLNRKVSSFVISLLLVVFSYCATIKDFCLRSQLRFVYEVAN